MLGGVHILLTYTCNFECDHCFLYCGPGAAGTFTTSQIDALLAEAGRIGTLRSIYFEGGEPFLYYPLMLDGIQRARRKGFGVGVVTNGYWATTIDDAVIWLKPLKNCGIEDLSISDDAFHYGDLPATPAQNAYKAARRLNMPADTICIQKPVIEYSDSAQTPKGAPVVGGGAKFRGRAVETLAPGLPGRPWDTYRECPYENLAQPGRVHIDAFGNVQICQGLSIGNCWESPLSEIVAEYAPRSHPIIGPLVAGGPAALVDAHDSTHRGQYVDACHLCFLTRLELLSRFPQWLGPRQVYGLKQT